MSPETITALSTGMIGVLGVIATILANRSKQRALGDRAARRAYRLLERKFQAALRHVFRLENMLAEHGHEVPERPEILESDDEDGPESAPVSADARA